MTQHPPPWIKLGVYEVLTPFFRKIVPESDMLRYWINRIFSLLQDLSTKSPEGKESEHSSFQLRQFYNNRFKKVKNMQPQQMSNPISKIRRKHFLKKGSNEKSLTDLKGHSLSYKAISVKQRAQSPGKCLGVVSKFREIGTETERFQCECKQIINQLTKQKEKLAKQLSFKESQYLELNLRYIALKEKEDTSLPRNKFGQNNENSCDFGDISNISENVGLNSSKRNKQQELAALKERLQSINVQKLLKGNDNSVILPPQI